MPILTSATIDNCNEPQAKEKWKKYRFLSIHGPHEFGCTRNSIRMWSKWHGNFNIVKFHTSESALDHIDECHSNIYMCANCAMAVFMWVIYSKVFVCWNLLSTRSYRMCIEFCGCENFHPNVKWFSQKYLYYYIRYITTSNAVQLHCTILPHQPQHYAITFFGIALCTHRGPGVFFRFTETYTNLMPAKFGALFYSSLSWFRDSRQVRWEKKEK